MAVVRRSLVVFSILWTGIICGHASEADALAISANIRARHMPFGTILDPSTHLQPATRLSATPAVGTPRCGQEGTWPPKPFVTK